MASFAEDVAKDLVSEAFELFANDQRGSQQEPVRGLCPSSLKAAMLFLYGYEPPEVGNCPPVYRMVFDWGVFVFS